MQSPKIYGIFLIIMLCNVSIVYGNTDLALYQEEHGLTPNGIPYQKINGNPFLDCSDPAHVFMRCDWWIQHLGGNVPVYPGPIIFLGLQLKKLYWEFLETPRPNGFYLDIIELNTKDGLDEPVTYGGIGQDDLSAYTDGDLGTFSYDTDHSFEVLSALMTIARGAQVIFIDIDRNPYSPNYDAGYRLDSNDLIDLILQKVDQYSAKVLFLALTDQNREFYTIRFEEVLQKGVYLITSAGNKGTVNKLFPVNRTEFRVIGSVDHEDRGKYLDTVFLDGHPIDIYDSDYYSKAGNFSGTSSYGLENCPGASLTLCSSWGGTMGRGTSFVAPGNGVPIYTYTAGEGIYPVYGSGTSYSSPYFAAMILVFLYAYKQGWIEKNPNFPISYPSPDAIDTYLRNISSQTTWDQKMGWGYFNLEDLYSIAFAKGYVDAPNPSNGGGGSGGIVLW